MGDNRARVQQDQRDKTDLSEFGKEVGQHEAEGPPEAAGGQVEEDRHQSRDRRGPQNGSQG